MALSTRFSDWPNAPHARRTSFQEARMLASDPAKKLPYGRCVRQDSRAEVSRTRACFSTLLDSRQNLNRRRGLGVGR